MTMPDETIYQDNGFANRIEYLKAVAELYDMNFKEQILPMARLLGRDEDFDGLLAMCADYAGCRVMMP